jgi:hypothetical protein
MFTSPLDNIRVASPCPANWDEMFGDERKRFCSECKLSVYNLSDMTRSEAENLLINSEGRLCVRYYKRADGTVLTTDCPIGWAKLKRRLSKASTAIVSLVVGLVSGLIGVRFVETATSPLPVGEAVTPVPGPASTEPGTLPIVGEAEKDDMVKGQRLVVGMPVLPAKKSQPHRLSGRLH